MLPRRTSDLDRIRAALASASDVVRALSGPGLRVERKAGGDPVTEVDLALDRALRAALARPGEGWLSEETADTPDRAGRARVWVVDPLDGTREFLEGIPEWAVSVGLVEEGRAVAGGVLNPATGEIVTGAEGLGVTLNGGPARVRASGSLEGALVLASRGEHRRGEWKEFEGAPFQVRPVGSVAYKLALVAAGRADATWTLRPKNEWDVAGGIALVRAAGGEARTPDGREVVLNRPDPLLPGLVACAPSLLPAILSLPRPR